MRCGCTSASVKISNIFQDLLFCLQKKVFATGLHALAHRLYWALQAIAVARLMFIVHDWFICTPDFSCCTNEILSRMSINYSPGEKGRKYKIIKFCFAPNLPSNCINHKCSMGVGSLSLHIL